MRCECDPKPEPIDGRCPRCGAIPEKKGLDLQMLVIRDKANFREMIDELDEHGIAILVTRKSEETGSQLRLSSFGEGQETEFLGLLGYATALMHRDYFRNE